MRNSNIAKTSLLVFLALAGMQASFCGAAASAQPMLDKQTVADAYVYLLGRAVVIRQEHTDLAEPGVTYNAIKYNPVGSADFVNPNLDVAYLEAWIAVDEKTPVVLEIPEVKDRYYVAQICDEWGDVIVNINERNFPSQPFGKYAFVAPGSKVNVPADAVRIELHSRKAKMLARVELKTDREGAIALQRQFTITPLGNVDIEPAPPMPAFNNKELSGVEIFDNVETILTSAQDISPVAAQAQAKVRDVARLAQDAGQRAALDKLIREQIVPEFLAYAVTQSGEFKNNWLGTLGTGNYGSDFWMRSSANLVGLWANTNDEVIYFVATKDADGEPLNGDNDYVIDFGQSERPDAVVNGYWSIILVDVPDYRVVPNPLNRFNLNSYSPLKIDDDGSLKILIAPESNQSVPESNWLPSPAGGNFSLTLRTYVPKDLVKRGEWFPPAVTRLDKKSSSADPKYKAKVPTSILTPDSVSTELLGNLEFFDGMPSKATVDKSYDFIDLSRATEAFLSGMPAASVYAILEGFKEAGMKPGDMGITEDLMDARSLYLTPNSTTPYCMVELNLENGPMVMEVPAGVLGPIGDAFFRWVSDVGLTGPDQGKGGKYLFVHTSYEGEIPSGYFVVKVPTFRNPAFFRAFVQNGDIVGAVRHVKENFRLYPLSQADNPPAQKFVNVSGLQYNTVHANDFHFFEEMNAVIQHEPSDAFNSEILGLFASIGIKKGLPFDPDARMKKILTEAVAIGNATARSICFAPRDKNVYYYPDRQWYASFAGSYDFMDNGAMMLDNRVLWHYIATGVTPAMSTPKIGTGSVYPTVARDSEGNYLDGGKTYTVTLPGPVPAKAFWAFTAYDSQTRSFLETDQKSAGLDSLNPKVKKNSDGSFTLWFGPKAPEGHEGNWVQTMPGKSYFVFMRLYGPLESWFDKTWRPGDFELVN